jgi:hypothetical protein
MLVNQNMCIDQFHCWFICVGCHLKDIQIHVLFNQPFDQQHPFQIQPMDANDNNILKT